MVAQGLGTRRRQHHGRPHGHDRCNTGRLRSLVAGHHAVAHAQEMTSRWREVAVAGHTGDTAAARAALTDPDPVTRELGLGATLRLGVLRDEDLRAAMADTAASVRRRAAMIAGQRPSV